MLKLLATSVGRSSVGSRGDDEIESGNEDLFTLVGGIFLVSGHIGKRYLQVCPFLVACLGAGVDCRVVVLMVPKY